MESQGEGLWAIVLWVVTARASLVSSCRDNRSHSLQSRLALVLVILGLPLLDLANDLREDAASEPVKPVRPHLLHERRPAFEWEDTGRDEQDNSAIFAALPNNNTIRELWDIFARRVLPFWPILHRPTVEVQISDLLHERSVSQARLVLLMAALASIYPPTTHNLEWRPPGWQYFSVVTVSHVELILQNEACLADVQVLAVSERETVESFVTCTPIDPD